MWHIDGQLRNIYLKRAYNAYWQAINNCDHCDTVWMSIGLLYYFKGQLRNCLDSFAWSVRLNPKVPLVWCNLALLVSSVVYSGSESLKLRLLLKYEQSGQYVDALNCYERAFELGVRDPQCWERMTALKQHCTQGSALPPLTLEMKDFDISKTTCETRELDENGLIEFTSLQLDDESASDGWRTSSDEDSDFEGD